ncbi:hypothetical protein SAMN04488519_11087 [Algoriphagus ornithinivorans]|uniref:Outer membrane protein beta-barrel domain-containing protein n=1 Tax=Algoriphagus ornithinivorans TaxID=226506 RepID=A0A1I5IWJ2_9BACT|nr:hypothetical protein [Algoriphagus ornithinivorans]SFO64954.1 hypothetical protein SAMN04488519_11087 [Algoriphagus ornithinivorans]
MKKVFQLFLALLFLVISSNSYSQNFYKERISRNNILTVGAGPSFSYIDNGGPYRTIGFEILPSLSVAWTKKLSQVFDLRYTVGYQSISSSNNGNLNVQEKWRIAGASFTAKGSTFYLDVMPSINLIPFSNHMHRSRFNIYGGAGIGVMAVSTKQTKSYSPDERPTNESLTTAYVPVRAGLSYRIGPYSDIAGEGTMLLTFTDNIDGNVGFNRFADHLFQAQIVFRRYILPKNKD